MQATQSFADPTGGPALPRDARPRKLEAVRSAARAASAGWSSPAGIDGPAERVAALARTAGAHVRKKPVSTLVLVGCAAFLVGGGLSFRGGRVLLAAALRHVTREVLKQVL